MIKTLKSYRLETVLRTLTYLTGFSALLTILYVLVWTTNKSFDFTDESFYAIGYSFNIELDYTVTFFHKIYNLFFGFLNLTLAQNRLLGIILTLICSLTLTHNSLSYFKIKNRLLPVLIVTVMSFLGHFIYPMALSYNSIGALLIMLIISTSLNYLNKRKKVTLVLIGTLTTLIIFNKFTNVVFLGLSLIAVLTLNHKEQGITKKNLATDSLLILAGITLTTFLLIPSIDNLKEAINGFLYGISLSTDHSLNAMVIRFYNELLRLLGFSIYLIPLFSLLTILTFSKNLFLKKHRSILVLTSIIITYIFLEYSTFLFTGTYNISVFYYLILLTSFALIIFYNRSAKLNKEIVFGLIFLIAPFIISLGTNNSLFVHFTFNSAIFGLGLFLVINNIPNHIVKHTLIIITLSTACFQICYNKIQNPYRSEPLNLQTEEIKGLPYLKNIKTTPELANTINELQEFTTHPAEKVFLCSHQLGVSIITNKQPLFFSWINEYNYHLISKHLENKKDDLDKNILFFIPSKEEDKKAIISELTSSKELNFNANYHYLKSIKINDNLLDIYEHN